MNMRCVGLVVVLVSLFAFGVAYADIEFAGVLSPKLRVVRMDSVRFLSPDKTILTPDWGSRTPEDTFVFAGIATWPDTVVLHGTIDGFPSYALIRDPLPGIWYSIDMVGMTQVKFYGDYGVEESRRAVEPLQCLTVSPSVVTGQMTVRLQPVRTGKQVVEIHDAAGNVIRSLGCTAGADGAATATWNREDNRGRLVPEGAYFCRYAAADVIAVRKIIVAH